MALLNLSEGETEDVLTLTGTQDLQGLKNMLESLAHQKGTSVTDLLCQMRNQSQLGPLHKVAMTGNLPAFDYMTDCLNVLLPDRPGLHNSVVNARSAVGTPLLLAAKNNHIGISQRLLNLGANPLISDPFAGWLPLHHAVQHNQLYLTHLLLSSNSSSAHVNAETRSAETPLLLACRNGHNNIASLLIQRGDHTIDKSARDAAGESAMHHAARTHNLKLVRKLGQAGVPTGIRNGQSQTPCDVARAGWLVWKDVDVAVAEDFKDIMDELDFLELVAEMER
jgi:ankyrin repeat protein